LPGGAHPDTESYPRNAAASIVFRREVNETPCAGYHYAGNPMLSEAAYNTEVPLYPCAAEAVRIYRYQYRGAKNDDEGSGPFAGLNDDAAMLIRFLRGKEKAAQFFCGTSVFGKWSGRAAELRTETGGSAVLGDIP